MFGSKEGRREEMERLRGLKDAELSSVSGRISWRNRVRRVHRVVASLVFGFNLNDEKTPVCHHCDNPPCFNPEHLYVGSFKQNTADMHQRRRGGDTHPVRDYCKRGHRFEVSNIFRKADGSKQCRTCRNDWQRREYRRRKDAEILEGKR